MRPFFAMLWDVTDPEAVAYASQIRSTMLAGSSKGSDLIEADGLLVCSLSRDGDKSNALIALRRKNGVVFGAVFGTLFEQSDSKPCRRFTKVDPETAERLYHSLGSGIVRDFWGNYVCFVSNGERRAIVVDPAASIPCFYTRK